MDRFVNWCSVLANALHYPCPLRIRKFLNEGTDANSVIQIRISAAYRKMEAFGRFQIQRQDNTTSAVTVAQLASRIYPFTVERSCAQYPLQFCHAQHQPALKSTVVLCCTSTKTCQHTQPVSRITNFSFSQYLSPFLQLLYLSLSYCFMFTGAGTSFAFFVKHPAL